MTMKKWLEIALNILFWTGSGWLIVRSFSIQTQEIELINDTEIIKRVYSGHLINQLLIFLVIAAGVFYGNLKNLTRLKHAVSKKPVIALSMILLSVGVLLLFVVRSFSMEINTIRLPVTISLGILLFYFTVSAAYGMGKVWIFSEQQNQHLMFVKKQAELNLLRNQLQPHFLFNALNNLLAMVNPKVTPGLAEAIDRLSHLLRYVIEEAKSDQVQLQKEIDFLRNYAALQLMRFEECEVIFNMDIRGDHLLQLVEPGLFIPFFENAFKYGTEPEKETMIDVVFDVTQKDQIQFQIQNAILYSTTHKNGMGTGIKSTKERLTLLYPKKHTLTVSENGQFKVELIITTA
jgi:sensor histidine kinase YesM